MAAESITIVGASLAGLRGAEALRRADFSGPITMIGAENHLPYDRPPLSKKILSGGWDVDRAFLTTPERLEEIDVTIRTGVTATGFDLDSRTLTTTEGDEAVDGMLIATGSKCRNIGGADQLQGVHILRSLDDCLAIRADLDERPERVVVIGAGFIGGEVAATIRNMGFEVTMIESADLPLQRVISPDLGAVVEQLHLDRGVDVRCGTTVSELISNDGRIEAVMLGDGSRIDTTLVVVGVGVVPNTEWLEGSGLTIDNGVVCDSTTLAAPGVTAAGDVARWPNLRFGGDLMRIEQWDNATWMGMHAAIRLTQADEEATDFTPVPWFWSDQFDKKLQLAGVASLDDEMVVVDGSLEEQKFVALFGREGRLSGVFGISRPAQVMKYRHMMEQDVSFSDAVKAEI